MAFHVTGTPTLAIADKIKKKDSETLSLYEDYISLYETDKKKIRKILSSLSEPKKVVDYFSGKIEKDFNSIGFSIDWTRKFNTSQKTYNQFIEWQYKKLNELRLLIKASYPVLYCLQCDNAVGEDDILDADINPVEKKEYTAIKFGFEDGYLLASTLRPETIFGVTNLWINPKAHYVKINVKGEKWFVSEASLENLNHQYDIIAEDDYDSDYFFNKEAKIMGRKVPILPAGIVNPAVGTGVVYSVPAHAPYDYMALKDLQKNNLSKEIKPVKIINIEGYGEPAKEICEKLRIKNQFDPQLEKATHTLYKEEFYKGILNDKCKGFSGMAISEIKDSVKDYLKKQNLAETFYEPSRKALCRCGGRIIVSLLKDQWFLNYADAKWKDKTRKLLNQTEIYPEKYKNQFSAMIDWLRERPCARKRGLGTKLPFDKAWIIESLSDSTIYMAFYTIAGIINKRKIKAEKLTEELFDFVFLGKGSIEQTAKKTGIGRKIIKEMRGEFLYWYPNDERHTAVAHISNHLSFFLMHHAALFEQKHWPKMISLNELVICEGSKMSKSKGNVIPLLEIAEKYGADLYRLYLVSSSSLDAVMDWKEKEVISVKKRLQKFTEICEKACKVKEKEIPYLSSVFYEKLLAYKGEMSKFNFRNAIILMFFDMLDEINLCEKRYKDVYSGVRQILPSWLIALSPVIPHLAEEFYSKLGKKNLIASEKWPADKKVNMGEIEKFRSVEKTISDIKNILQIFERKKKKAEVVYAYVVPKDKYFLENSEYIEKRTGKKIRVLALPADYDPQNKAKKAKPGKPALYIE